MSQEVRRVRVLLVLAGLALVGPGLYSCATLQESDQYGDASLDPPEGGNGGNAGNGGMGGNENDTAASTQGGVSSVTVTLGVSNTTSDSDGSTSTSGSAGNASNGTTDGSAGTGGTSGNGGTGGADECPDDPDKSEAGQCGCGMADTDTDSDGTADCNDGCPDDPEKTDPGDCGCGIPDDASCAGLQSSLIHRYMFDGNGSTITDSVGNADGTLVGGTQSGGSVSLDGSAHVELPGGLVSSLSAVTIELWYEWNGGDDWQRIFDFGVSDAGSGSQGNGESYLFLTPGAEGRSGFLRAAFSPAQGNTNEVYVEASSASPSNTTVHAAVAVDASSISLYRGDSLEGSTTMTAALSSLSDDNNWLGWSQFAQDPVFDGTIHEFRIYDAALDEQQIQTSDSLGPDAPLGN